ncbi:hypothetical protein MM236_08480 [Belliella sp. DSM 107340]|uniref:Uncharacterized protein n=1 Tax=Belliella calami TaxID=2923436 RepID=A0ABS9UN57_9BACT|nr:hypothetical protein [Belliella calami]MCH7398022.1 hypothetical protein [Belliella calami]
MEAVSMKTHFENSINVYPAIGQIQSFFYERKVPLEEAELFYYFHESVGWRTDSGVPILDWKPFAKQWIGNLGY